MINGPNWYKRLPVDRDAKVWSASGDGKRSECPVDKLTVKKE